jgi:hypothetical protein
LFITYLCLRFTSFIYLTLITTGIGHGLAHVHLCPKEDRSPSCLRHPFGYVTFSFLKLSNGFSLLADSFLWLYVIPFGFIAVNMELPGTTRQVPSFGI